MKTRSIALVVAFAALVFVPCRAGVTRSATEDFEGTLEDATWRMEFGDEIAPSGGNPGAFLHAPAALTAIPVVSTSEASIFTGPYRFMGVIALGIDVNVVAVGGAAGDRPVSLGLSGRVYADGEWVSCELVLPGDEMPQAGSPWRSYDFRVPAWKDRMPPKWVAYGPCASLPPEDAWNGVMSQVAVARIYVGDPSVSHLPLTWDIGFDNARITFGRKGAPPARVSSGAAVPMAVVPEPGE